MNDSSADFNPILDYLPQPPARSNWGIGMVGAGFIVRDIQSLAYRNAHFNMVAITSRTPEIAHEVAELRGIPRVYDSVTEMLDDPAVEILDIAVPPDQQLRIVQEAVRARRLPK